MDDLVVRKSTRDDYQNIKALLDGLNKQDRHFLALDLKENALRKAARQGRHCYVADKNGDVVGLLRESGRPGGSSYLEELVVSPKYRGNGVATAMLSRYHEEFPHTTAKSKPDNGPIKHILESHGYTVEDPEAKSVLKWSRG